MKHEQGSISINSENIMPIIKKWLYSDSDIFVREMVSNASDAITKYKRLVSMGEVQNDDNAGYKIVVTVSKKEKTLKFSDNGIGMTAEEVKKYINQIAFSGAMDFIEKYKNKTDAENDIIGHFGLGFYSVFMVADKVVIDTLSYEEEAEAVRWSSDGGAEYKMEDSGKTTRGTDITISVSKDSKEFLDEYKIKQVLYKYCSFMPYEIYLVNADIKEKDDKSTARKEEPINDVSPLWLKNPSDCTEENYKEFYHKVFTDFNDPLFWIHLNMDYPFRLKGILYFPKLKNDFGPNDGQIKLYNNQVFVADNIKEVIPEFLLLLKGMLDCPDLPLNVSRSYLQNDGYVNKISSHITKKVSDKLASLYKNERDNYNKYWDDIHPFIKYGCVRDEKFYEKVKDIIIFKTISGEYATLPEFLEKNREKSPDKVFYVTDEKQQAQYIKMYKDGKMDAVILDSLIDTNFIQFLEMKNEKVKFSRIDADLSETMKDEHKSDAPNEDTIKKLTEIFNFAKESKKLEIKVENLKSADTPAIILLSENSRRMQDMTKIFGSMNMTPDMFPVEQTLVLNAKNNLIKRLVSLSEDESNKEDIEMLSRHICDLALIANKQLEPGEMSEFIDRSSKLMVKIAEKQI